MTDPVSKPSPRADDLRRALLLSLLALAVPVVGAFNFPDAMADYEALLWLLAVVPAFLLAYHRGWRGVATALAMGMAALSLSYATGRVFGQAMPDLLLAVVAAFIAFSLLVGWHTERVARRRLLQLGSNFRMADPLTGLPNRAHAEFFLEREFAAGDRGRDVAVAVFDLDHMRTFDADNGRTAGDDALRAFAGIVRANTRQMNLAARWGGDVFVAVLGACREEGALIFAERVQERFRAVEYDVPLPTVSVGIAAFRPGMTRANELVAAAQEACVSAKADGRDRIRIASADVAGVRRRAEALRDQQVTPGVADAGAEAVSVAQRESVRPLGDGRRALVFSVDAVLRERLSRYLMDAAFDVREVPEMALAVDAIKAEYDVVFVDIVSGTGGAPDLVTEVRARQPATRIIGLPRTAGGTLDRNLLLARVDAYHLPEEDPWSLAPRLRTLLDERDRLRDAMLRNRQLSEEVRAVRRQAIEELRESQERYRAVVENVQEVLFTTDEKGGLAFLNLAWKNLTGFDPAESTGWDFLAYIHPDDHDVVREPFDRLLAGDRPALRMEARCVTRDGGDRWVEMNLIPTQNNAGQVTGALGTLMDVTQRHEAEEAVRRSEEYFRALIENSADLIVLLSREATIRYVSPAIEKILGYEREEQRGRNVLDLIHPDDVETARTALARVLEDPTRAYDTELRVRRTDGSHRILEASGRDLSSVPGVGGIVINARDVTDRRRAEDALRESENALLQAQKMDAIGRLAGGVAHDFNNLLTTMQGHVELLAPHVGEHAEAQQDLQEIRSAATRAGTLTRQLLAFSRRQVMQPRVMDLNATVEGIHKMLSRLIGEHIELTTELERDIGSIVADPGQVEQVILNLCVNARDAMPTGGHLTIRTFRTELPELEEGPDGGIIRPYVGLSVTDDGQGMEAEELSRVFEPIFTTKEADKGTGLGLSTVYGIVKQSGGRVEARSQPGQGSTFVVFLPQAPDVPPASGEPQPRRVVAAGGTETILFVEDEQSVRDLAVRVLRGRGYEVLAATNGRTALELLERTAGPIDLLITDVVMPEMDGRTLAEQVSARLPGVPVIFISGYAEDAIAEHGVLRQGAEFLEKPFTPDTLLACIREVLDRPAAGRH
ncbi:MAG: PAS domain S-box protein [Gemmatimonadota bacterium]